MRRLLPRPGTVPFRILAGVAITTVLAAGAALLLEANVFQDFRLETNDRFFPVGERDDRIAVVELGPQIVEEVDGWPLPYEIHADLVDRIAADEPALIVYDLVFDLPREGIDRFAAAIADAGNVVMATSGDTLDAPGPDQDLYQLAGTNRPEDVLQDVALATGHANVVVTQGFAAIRSVPLVADDGRLFSPALSLAAAAAVDGHDPAVVTIRRDGRDGPVIGAQVGETFYPTDRHGLLEISWAPGLEGHRDTPVATPSIDVLEERVDPGTFTDKIVIIGPADPLIGDIDLTPVTKKEGGAPGLYVHANALNTMLTQHYRLPLDVGDGLVPLVVGALVVALLVLFLPLWTAPIVVLVAVGANALFSDLQFETGQSIDLLYPTMGMILSAAGAVAVKYLTEVRDRRRVAELFSQYIPASVADQLVDENSFEQAIAGQRQDITVFFCDLRGFTATSSTMDPKDVRRMLEVFYEVATNLVLDHGGTLMQFVGDEVFAVFGVPIPQDDHAERALACARALQAAQPDIVAQLAEQGLPSIQYGVGLNSGPVVAAHVGTSLRKQYSVIGDTVNVGARLCSLAKAGQVVISGRVSDRCSTPPAGEELGPVELKGVSDDPRARRVKL